MTLRNLVAPPSAGGRPPPPIADGSVVSLLTANVVALIVALVLG